jgi:hypothetical protein
MDGRLIGKDTLYLLEENSRIYYWTGTEFKMMYDFTLTSGDTLEMQVTKLYGCDSVTPITVDSIGLINIMGTSLKVLYYSYTLYSHLTDPPMEPYNLQDAIIERIGRASEFIFSQPFCGLDVLFTENRSLRCYTDRDFNYKTGWFTQRYNNAPCDTLIYGEFEYIKKANEDLVKIYPNPCHDKVWIEQSPSPITSIKILNTSGILIFNEDTVTKNLVEINTGNYRNGLYFVIITTGNTYYTSKLIKL